MIKWTVINSRLAQALADARHGDAIVLCDANMPIPPQCSVIDLSLTRGTPTLLQTVKAILNDLVAERYELFSLMPQYNPEMSKELARLLTPLPGGTVDREQLEALMPRARAVVRTGDMGSCCTMVLYSASGMEKYVERFQLSFPQDGAV